MKKQKIYAVFIPVLTLAIILSVIIFNAAYYEFMHYFMLYDRVEYNGDTYHLYDGSHGMDVDFDSEVNVHLVDKNGKIYRKQSEKARLYVGDESAEYLYFDSAVWIKEGSSSFSK